jgi:perosamine synthetase
LKAHDIGPGDEVLVSDFSWISSASCISMTGATPVFCDIDIASYTISLESIERMYSPKVKAIVYTHLFGNIVDTTEIRKFCKEKGIAFIEDSAQSLGSSLNGTYAGTIGDSSSFSFNTNKVIAGINGGGVYLTDNDKLADSVKKLRKHGKSKDFETLGYNSKMYFLNASVIDFRLQSLEKNKKVRQEIAADYDMFFEDLPIVLPPVSKGADHNYHKYVIRVEDKDTRKSLKEFLGASIHYEIALSDNSMYQNIEHRKDSCTNSRIVADTVLSLPIHAWLTEEEVLRTASSVIRFFTGVK